MNRAVFVLLEILLSATAAAALTAQAQAPLIVAYVVSDGELVPIARYDGGAWRNTWPELIEHDAPLPVRAVDEIPRAWLGQPVPLTWTAWSPATGKQQRLAVTGVDRDGSCFQAITLATSSRPGPPPSDGLAFNRLMSADAIVELEESSPEWNRFRRAVAPHFRAAIANGLLPQPADEQELGAKVFARARADAFAEETVRVPTVFRDPRLPLFFIEAQRQFDGIQVDTNYDAVSYGGWFTRERAGNLIPIGASVVGFSTAQGKLPRYTPIGILRFGGRSIWVMSEWGIESETIVLFDVAAKGVRKLTSAAVSGC